MGIWKCSSGPGIMDANGIAKYVQNAASNGNLEMIQWARNNGCEWDSRVHVHMLPIMDIWRLSNGPEKMDVTGTSIHAYVPLNMDIWKCFSGRGTMDANGIAGYADMLMIMDMRKWRSGPEIMVVLNRLLD